MKNISNLKGKIKNYFFSYNPKKKKKLQLTRYNNQV